MDFPTIVIVGCGYFAEKFYINAFLDQPALLERLILVDSDEERLKYIASKYHISNICRDYKHTLRYADGAIISVPHQLHYKISMDFLREGVHVMCEKPLCQSGKEADDLINQAQKSGISISANYTQRLFPSSIKIKELISKGKLGRLKYIFYEWGSVFSWPTVSGFYFNSRVNPQGVLFDRGPHPIDLICWWLGEKPRLITSENDSFGGPEAVARVHFRRGDCEIEIRVSWLSELSNRLVISGELGTIENKIEDYWVVPVRWASGENISIKCESEERNYYEFGKKLMANFIDIITNGAKPFIPASEVIPSIQLIEECYRKPSRFKMPWYTIEEVSSAPK